MSTVTLETRVWLEAPQETPQTGIDAPYAVMWLGDNGTPQTGRVFGVFQFRQGEVYGVSGISANARGEWDWCEYVAAADCLPITGAVDTRRNVWNEAQLQRANDTDDGSEREALADRLVDFTFWANGYGSYEHNG